MPKPDDGEFCCSLQPVFELLEIDSSLDFQLDLSFLEFAFDLLDPFDAAEDNFESVFDFSMLELNREPILDPIFDFSTFDPVAETGSYESKKKLF